MVVLSNLGLVIMAQPTLQIQRHFQLRPADRSKEDKTFLGFTSSFFFRFLMLCQILFLLLRKPLK